MITIRKFHSAAVLIGLMIGCNSTELPPIASVPVAMTSIEESSDAKDWHPLTTPSFTFKIPFLESPTQGSSPQMIGSGERSVLILGLSKHESGEFSMIAEAIDRIKDGSNSGISKHDCLAIARDLYSFDSEKSPFKGEYRKVLHQASHFLRYKHIRKVTLCSNHSNSMQLAVFYGSTKTDDFAICELYSMEGKILGKLKMRSSLGDCDWMRKAMSTAMKTSGLGALESNMTEKSKLEEDMPEKE